jgi:uncharacterized protein
VEREAALRLIDRLHEMLGAFYAGGDVAPLRDMLAEDVEWHVPGKSPIAGDYYGRDAVFDYFARRRDLAGGTFRMHPGEVLVGDSHVAVITDGTATLAGREHRWRTIGLYRVDQARISACWLLPLDPVHFDSIWSAAAS